PERAALRDRGPGDQAAHRAHYRADAHLAVMLGGVSGTSPAPMPRLDGVSAPRSRRLGRPLAGEPVARRPGGVRTGDDAVLRPKGENALHGRQNLGRGAEKGAVLFVDPVQVPQADLVWPAPAAEVSEAEADGPVCFGVNPAAV